MQHKMNITETRGFPLPETIEDGENFGKKEKKKLTA